MNSLPLDWSQNLRPDRPFPAPRQPFPRPPIPPHRQPPPGPTAYYLQQMPFYAPNHGADPFAHIPLAVRPGPLKILYAALSVHLAVVFSIFAWLGGWAWFLLYTTAQYLLIQPAVFLAREITQERDAGIEGQGQRGKGMEWKMFFLLLVLADRIVRLLLLQSLPTRDLGGGKELELELEPVYRLFVGSGREVIASGSGFVQS